VTPTKVPPDFYQTKKHPMGAISGPGILHPKRGSHMEFFYVVKATQKSGKEDAVIWFTAKSEARANLQLDVELEDAGIETGRQGLSEAGSYRFPGI
jgi:hypothetical protein